MEKLDFTKNILQKYGIPFDVEQKGDILDKKEVKVRDVFSNDKKLDTNNDILFDRKKTDEGFNGLA